MYIHKWWIEDEKARPRLTRAVDDDDDEEQTRDR